MNAIMPNFDVDPTNPNRPPWEGFSEIDQAIRDNRMMEYRLKKSWADPWGRALTIFVLAVMAIFAAFVMYSDVFSR